MQCSLFYKPRMTVAILYQGKANESLNLLRFSLLRSPDGMFSKQ